MKSVKKTPCRKLAGCPAFSCEDDNCIGWKIPTHKPPLVADDVAVVHNHRWYHGARWGTIRTGQLSREPLCQRCISFDIVTAAEHVDHVVEHKGSAALFFDAGNLQSLCRSCHSFKSIEERKGNILDYRSFSHK